MKRQIAVKSLTASDLTLFETHYRGSLSKQKGINLNANIFVHRLYPNINEISVNNDRRFNLSLSIYGPDAALEDSLVRKVIKDASSKNWRLNGELIFNPPEEENRYDSLAVGDLAVMEFTGGDYPVGIRMVLLSASNARDALIYQSLAPQVSSMSAMSVRELGGVLSDVDVPDNHPIYNLLVDEALEDAAMGGARGTEQLFVRRRVRRVSRLELAQARQRAGEIGYLGEALVQTYLDRLIEQNDMHSFQWVSDQNAVAPYDFELTHMAGEREYVDVKATQGDFARALHLSLAELHVMADATVPYRIYRVHDLGEGGGFMRVSEPLAGFAGVLIASLAHLPLGVQPDSFSIDPNSLTFGGQISIRFAEAEVE